MDQEVIFEELSLQIEESDGESEEEIQLITTPTTPTIEEVVAEIREEDDNEERKRAKFLEEACGCLRKCCKEFDSSYTFAVRDNFMEMTTKEKEMVVMGEMMASTRVGDTTCKEKERVNDYTIYSHCGIKV